MSCDKRDDQNQAQTGTSKGQASNTDAFVKHLEHASSVVQTWPAWKQQILGGTPTPTPPVPNKAKGSDH